MKKNFALLLLLLTLAFSFQSCIKDKCSNTYHYTYYVPIYKTTAEVRANIHSNAPRPIERPGKIYIKGSYIFLNEIDKGIHIIDNSNPASPVNKAFIDIPGNMDIAVKGNSLYADLYTDMVTIDISNPLNISVTKILDGVFPFRYYGNFSPDSRKIIASWQKRDTTVVEDCSVGISWFAMRKDVFINYTANTLSTGGSAAVSPYGVGGSMARFAILNDRLYTVSNADLNTFNISNGSQPFFTSKTNIVGGIETIYPFKNNLFIGSTTGMFIYNISSPDNPVQTGQFSHVRSCDPVIADDNYAYVTIRSGTGCGGASNQLDVLQLNSLFNPILVKSYQLTNPQGLSKDSNLLFVCDGTAGLKFYNAANVNSLQLISQVSTIQPHDVIAMNGVAIVVADEGLYQFSYSNPSALTLLSKISVSK